MEICFGEFSFLSIYIFGGIVFLNESEAVVNISKLALFPPSPPLPVVPLKVTDVTQIFCYWILERVYVCVYICMYVCMYVFMYVCMYIPKHSPSLSSLPLSLSLSKHTHTPQTSIEREAPRTLHTRLRSAQRRSHPAAWAAASSACVAGAPSASVECATESYGSICIYTYIHICINIYTYIW